jgi:lysophospholipase L1-like esterase
VLLFDRETDPSEQMPAKTSVAVPVGATVLLGDSIAAWAPWPLPNLGICGIRSDQLLERLDDLPWRNAGRVILSIGTNDVLQWRARGLRQRVSALVDRLDKPVILLGIAARHPLTPLANRALRRAEGFFVPPPNELRDSIHLNERGYELFYEAVGSAINAEISAA